VVGGLLRRLLASTADDDRDESLAWVRNLDHTMDVGFECAPLAPLIVQLTLNQPLGGSSPPRLTIIFE
jgi:hypothetical protein